MKQRFIPRFLIHLVVYVLMPGLINTASAAATLQDIAEAGSRNAAIQNETLEPGKPIKREMKGGETHSYLLTLTAGQFLYALVDQRGVDMVITLFDPEGKQVIQIDSPNDTQEPEPVRAIAELTGSYRLEVRSLEKEAKPGRYEVRIEELRAASQQDRKIVAGERAFMEAEELRLQGDAASLRKAVAKYEEALQVARSVGNRLSEAETLNNIGYSYDSLGEKKKALDYYDQALSLRQKLGDRTGEAETLNNIGYTYDSLGEKKRALDYYNQALPIFQNIGDDSGEAATLNNIGAVYNSLGEKQRALDYYNRALPLFRAAGGRLGEASTFHNMGAIYDDLGEKQTALGYYNQALSIFRDIDERSSEAVTLNSIGKTYDDLGEKQTALSYYNQSLPLRREAGDYSGEAETLNNIGAIYDSLGEKKKALDHCNQGLPLFRKVGDRSGEARVLTNIGAIYNSLGEKKKSLNYYNQALSLRRKVGDRTGEAETLNNIGVAYHSLGEKKRALGYYNQALPIFHNVGNDSGEAATLNNIGEVYDSLSEKKRALGYYNRGLPLFRKVGDRSGEAITLTNIGYVYELLGQKQKALDFYLQAIAKIESLRESATIEEIKTGLSERSSYTYQRLVPLLLQLGKPAQAFDLTERARARTFLDQMGNVRLRQFKTSNPQLVQEEQTLASELTSLERTLRRERGKLVPSLPPAHLTYLENQLAAKRRLYEDLLVRIKLTNPEYASLRSVNTLTLPEIQQILDSNTTLLSYFVTLDVTLAFIITRDSFRAVEIPVKEIDLVNSINWFHDFASLFDSQPESLKKLYGWLIAPLKPYIKTSSVCIIPHAILNYLPFAALTDGRSYFGDSHTLFYLPGASVLPFIHNKSKPVGNHLLAVAQNKADAMSVLHYVDEEATSVADLYDTKAMTTGSASKSEFLKRAGDYTILHIAAHAGLNATNPLFSRILLGQSKDDIGALEVREVYDLDLAKTSLVVLSACETLLGSHSRGDDMVGLNRAFIYAGAPTVIASLWTVDDESTGYLMKSFYTHLKQGRGKAEALQAAQSDTRKKYPHPHDWASFVLTGDPGSSSQTSRTLNR
jgi:CHAT domain-containing protein/tetratricopeptide (TPR) repeat protein